MIEGSAMLLKQWHSRVQMFSHSEPWQLLTFSNWGTNTLAQATEHHGLRGVLGQDRVIHGSII